METNVSDLNEKIAAGNYMYLFNYSMALKPEKNVLDINKVGRNGLTPLITAVSYPNKNMNRIVSILLRLGADPASTGLANVSPLIAVLAKKAPPHLVKKLINKGAPVNEKMAKDLTPLLVAVKKDADLSVIKVLLKKDADPNVISTEGEIPLLLAIKKDNVKLVDLLLDYHANPNIKNSAGEKPLTEAVGKGNFKIVSLLLKKNADVNPVLSDDSIPLIIAVKKNDMKLVKLLLDYKAELNVVDPNGETPLTAAVETNNEKLVSFLLDNKADPNLSRPDGKNPLSVAVEKSDIKLVRLLLDNNANPNGGNSEENIPLVVAIKKDDIKLAELLLNNNADPFFPIGETKNVMDFAIQNASAEMAKELMLHSDKEKTKQHTVTALKNNLSGKAFPEFLKTVTSQEELDGLYLSAAENGSAETMLHLKSLNANVLKTKNGKTGLEILKAQKTDASEALQKIEEITNKALELIRSVSSNETENVEKLIADYKKDEDESFKTIKTENEFNAAEAGIMAKAGMPVYSLLQQNGLSVQNDDQNHLKKIANAVLKNNPNPEIADLIIRQTSDEMLDFEQVALALKNSNPEIFSVLLTIKPDLIDKKSDKGESVLSFAVQNGTAEQIDFLLSAAPVGQEDKEHILSDALIRKLPLETIRKLIASEVAVNSLDQQNETPLMTAVRNGCSLETITLLVESGAGPDMENKKKKNAYEIATATKKCNQAVKAYLKSVTTPKITPAKKRKAVKKEKKAGADK